MGVLQRRCGVPPRSDDDTSHVLQLTRPDRQNVGVTEPGRFVAAADLLKALANPHRVAIVDLLAAGPRRVHEITETLGLDQPLVSQHLRVLRDAHLLGTERQGKEVVYSLADDHIAHIVGDAITHAGER